MFLYNPITAADEKIPLSVVRVNKKPQYLVFCLHSPHPPAKHGHSACGKLKYPCAMRFLAAQCTCFLDAPAA
jgi:hypothetical protein